MSSAAITGIFWAVTIWVVWYGYWFFGAPRWLKQWVYGTKMRMLMLDALIVMVAGAGMTSVSGSVTAGIGGAILALLCLLTTFAIYVWGQMRRILLKKRSGARAQIFLGREK